MSSRCMRSSRSGYPSDKEGTKYTYPGRSLTNTFPTTISCAAVNWMSWSGALDRTPSNSVIQDQLQEGVVEVVANPSCCEGERVHYLPHHPVISVSASWARGRCQSAPHGIVAAGAAESDQLFFVKLTTKASKFRSSAEKDLSWIENLNAHWIPHS